MRLRRHPSTAQTMDDATPARRSAWDGIAVSAEAPVVVIHARRAGEIAAEGEQQVA